jgi:hypothetical protein
MAIGAWRTGRSSSQGVSLSKRRAAATDRLINGRGEPSTNRIHATAVGARLPRRPSSRSTKYTNNSGWGRALCSSQTSSQTMSTPYGRQSSATSCCTGATMLAPTPLAGTSRTLSSRRSTLAAEQPAVMPLAVTSLARTTAPNIPDVPNAPAAITITVKIRTL